MKKMNPGFFLVSYMATLDGGSKTLWGDTTFTVTDKQDPEEFVQEIRTQIKDTVGHKLDNNPTIVNIVRLV